MGWQRWWNFQNVINKDKRHDEAAASFTIRWTDFANKTFGIDVMHFTNLLISDDLQLIADKIWSTLYFVSFNFNWVPDKEKDFSDQFKALESAIPPQGMLIVKTFDPSEKDMSEKLTGKQ